MAKLREGQTVLFQFNGITRIGVVEDIKIINKSKRYQCRDEAGRLFPHLGINTVEPGKIDLALTEKYMAKKAEEGITVKVPLGVTLYHDVEGNSLSDRPNEIDTEE